MAALPHLSCFTTILYSFIVSGSRASIFTLTLTCLWELLVASTHSSSLDFSCFRLLVGSFVWSARCFPFTFTCFACSSTMEYLIAPLASGSLSTSFKDVIGSSLSATLLDHVDSFSGSLCSVFRWCPNRAGLPGAHSGALPLLSISPRTLACSNYIFSGPNVFSLAILAAPYTGNRDYRFLSMWWLFHFMLSIILTAFPGVMNVTYRGWSLVVFPTDSRGDLSLSTCLASSVDP